MKQKRRRWPLVVTALVSLSVGVMGTLGIATYLQEMIVPPVRKFQLLIPGQAPRTHAAAISPDGHQIAYIADARLWLRPLADLAPRMVPNSEGAALPFWSPASDIVGYFNATGGTLNALAVKRNTAVVLCRLPTPGLYGGAAWRPDGTIIFSQGPAGLYAVSKPGGTPQTFLTPQTTSQDAGFYAPAFLPDGKTCVFAVWKKNGSWTIDAVLESGERRQIIAATPGDMITGPTYAPSGHLLYNRMERGHQRIWAVPFSTDRLTVTGEPFPVTSEGSWPSISNTNTLIYSDSAGRSQQQLFWMTRSGDTLGPLGSPQEKLSAPAISPQANRVAVAGMEQDVWDIWLYGVAEGTRSRLTFDENRESHPVWSGNGNQVAFMAEQGDATRIVIMEADGSQERDTVMKGKMDDYLAPTWSSDGNHVVYQAFDQVTDAFDLWYVSLKKGERTPVRFTNTPFDEALPQFSPDGRYLAYQSNKSGEWEIYVIPFPGGDQSWQISTGGGSQPRWSYGSEELFFVRQDWLTAVRVRTGPRFSMVANPFPLFQLDDPLDDPLESVYDTTRDGQRFVLVKNTAYTTVSTLVVVEHWSGQFRNGVRLNSSSEATAPQGVNNGRTQTR